MRGGGANWGSLRTIHQPGDCDRRTAAGAASEHAHGLRGAEVKSSAATTGPPEWVARMAAGQERREALARTRLSRLSERAPPPIHSVVVVATAPDLLLIVAC